MSSRERADKLLVARGLAPTRAKAQAIILAGQAVADDRRIDKPGQLIDSDAALRLKSDPDDYVSRGAHKLIAGLDGFSIDPAGLVCLDIGASTGGFTDVLLRRGAAKVYAVDVGHGQLAWSLRQHPRVVVLERTNARNLSTAEVPEAVDLLVCDASFIGLRTVLPAPLSLLRPGGRAVALIKPQFEVGRENLGKKGVVRDPALHEKTCAEISVWFESELGWRVLGLAESPLLGPEGNKEFLIAAQKPDATP
jgi:23S rRNA (cytidine1920-2'-O)/16S rRNA (cytidine1409-2'-O)-methyltransferase